MSKESVVNKSPIPHCLNDKWVLWYHPVDTDDWTINGYEQIIEIETVEDFWLTFNKIRDFSFGMFFLMRKGCLPIWETYDEKVHFVKYRSNKKFYFQQWLNLCKASIGEIITGEPRQIVGVSISPKMKNIIIRIWMIRDSAPDFLPELNINMERCLFE
jgi:hypothetical protein